MFLAPNTDPNLHCSNIKTDEVELFTVGVPNYKEACKVASKLLQNGISAIELCGGFGDEGVARIKKAVNGRIVVGVVRFDIHPGLGNKSGDTIF